MKITTVGFDLAKNVFQVHGVDQHGKVVLKTQLRRHQVAEFFAQLPSCMIGMEACGSAHYWARTLQGLGHTVRLISPQFVKPYVKTNKNDAADAEAICEAVGRPNMRFVPVKNVPPRWAMRRTSPVDDSWLPGWGWFHASAQVAARACCWA
jgi:transposase